MEYNSLLELAKTRRSIRNLKPDPVPDELINKVIEVARWAPSGMNVQPWEFIIIKKKELRDKIVHYIEEDQERTYEMETVRKPELRFRFKVRGAGYAHAPVFIIICGDTRSIESFPVNVIVEQGKEVFHSSLANAFIYMHLAAASLGLGSQWVTTVARPYPQAMVKHLLGIPEIFEIYDMMAVGYPTMTMKPRFVRPLEEMVHHEGFDMKKFKTDKQVKEYTDFIRESVSILQPLEH